MKYKVGQAVVITANEFGHEHKIGDIVLISGRYTDSTGEVYRTTDGWHVRDCEIAPVDYNESPGNQFGLVPDLSTEEIHRLAREAYDELPADHVARTDGFGHITYMEGVKKGIEIILNMQKSKTNE